MRRGGTALGLLLVLSVFAGGVAGADAATFRGRLEVRHSDDFRHARGQTTWTLVRHGRRTPLLPTARPPLVRSGGRVSVHGHRRGRWIEGRVRRRGGAIAHAATALGNHSVAVLLFNFTDDTREPWTPAYVDQRIFGDPDSTAAFYNEQSHGALTVSGDVYGWYTINQPRAGCDVDAWASAARAAAAAANVDLSLYDHVQYVFPQQASCNWAGLGELPGEQTWLNGDISVRVAAHELGHNMGLHHASSYSCWSGSTPVTFSSDCSASEYGDPFDVMGLNARHSNDWHLSQLGIVSGSAIQTVTASGTYSLRADQAAGTAPVLLRIPTGGSPARWYDVEIRQPDGVFDNFASNASVVNGVSIHWDPTQTAYLQSLLLDATPGSGGGFTDSALAQGRTFSDGEVSITASSVGPGAATVEVVLGPTPDTDPPSAPANVAATATSGQVDLSWSLASDNVGVAGYRVYRDDALIATTPYAGYSDRAVAAGSTYRYAVAAYDEAGNATMSAPVFASVPADPPPSPPTTALPRVTPDTRPPTVRILSPRRGRRLGRRVRIAGTARDASGIAEFEIRVDGRRLASRRATRIHRTWSLRRVRHGRHTITLRARDLSGNVATRSVRVRVRRR